jgi:hypothetical protein
MLKPDAQTRRAVEKAARAVCRLLDDPARPADACARLCRLCREAAPAAIAAFLREMGQDIAAARVERCGGDADG